MADQQTERQCRYGKQHWAANTCEGFFYGTVLLLVYSFGVTTFKSYVLASAGLNEQVLMGIAIAMLLSAIRGGLLGAGSYFLKRSARANPTGWKGILSIVLTLVAFLWAL